MTDSAPGIGRRSLLAGAATTGIAALAGCSSDSLTGSNETSTTTHEPLKTLQITPGSAPVGQTVRVTGSGLPSNARLDLEWERIDGTWQITGSTTIREAAYASRFEKRGTVRTDSTGSFTETLTVPEDHGGKHVVRVSNAGTPVAKGTLAVERTYSIDSKRVPLGETFTVTVRGMKHSRYRRVDQVLWDSGFAGYITATESKGTARAEVPAAAPPGRHMLEVSGGHMSPYLNPQQSPYPRDPRLAKWEVTVTRPTMSPGEHWKRPRVNESPLEAFYPNIENPRGDLSVADTSGVVGSTTTVEGSNFPANESVRLRWATMSGSRVTSGGFHRKYSTLATVATDNAGSFSEEVTIPDDLGGTHPIVADVGGTQTAVTGFVVRPSVAAFTPSKGPLGTTVEVHLKGVGWTEYDNAYAVSYDDDYVGYVCGFNSKGDVKIQLEASGQPGYHTITCYPMLYKKPVQKRKVSFWNRPQLTYLDDHPVRPVPAFGFLFEVTED